MKFNFNKALVLSCLLGWIPFMILSLLFTDLLFMFIGLLITFILIAILIFRIITAVTQFEIYSNPYSKKSLKEIRKQKLKKINKRWNLFAIKVK